MYIDEHAVVRQLTGASAGEYYYLLKELYSVAGLAKANGGLVEAYTYDAYGKVRVFTAQAAPCDDLGDVDGDCDVDIADFEILSLCYFHPGVPEDCPIGAIAKLDFDTDADIDDVDLQAFADVVTGPKFGLFADGDWNSNGSVGPVDHNKFVNVCYSGPGGGFNTNGCQVFDFDGDNDVDLDDYGVLLALWYETSPNAPVTLTLADASPVNDYYFTGRSLDFVPHGGERHQRYYYRARTYNTERFMQRDALIVITNGMMLKRNQYSDAMNLFEYARSKPASGIDPHGLQFFELPDDWPNQDPYRERDSSCYAALASVAHFGSILGRSCTEDIVYHFMYGGGAPLPCPRSCRTELYAHIAKLAEPKAKQLARESNPCREGIGKSKSFSLVQVRRPVSSSGDLGSGVGRFVYGPFELHGTAICCKPSTKVLRGGDKQGLPNPIRLVPTTPCCTCYNYTVSGTMEDERIDYHKGAVGYGLIGFFNECGAWAQERGFGVPYDVIGCSAALDGEGDLCERRVDPGMNP